MKYRISHKKIVAIAVLLIVIAIVEVYAHTYVQLDHLPIVTTEEALSTPFLYNNGTIVYSVDGAKWMFVFSYWRSGETANSGMFDIYTFKLQDNTSFPIQSANIEPISLTFKFSDSYKNLDLIGDFRQDVYLNKCTIVSQEFIIPSIGKYDIDVGLTFRVYRETPLGYIPGQEETVHFNTTFNYIGVSPNN